MQYVLDAIIDTVYYDGDCLLGGLWQGERHVWKDVVRGRRAPALNARDLRAHLPVEQEIDDWPVTQQAVRPLLQAKLVQVAVLAVWVLDVGLLHAQVQLLVQPVDQERYVLLAVLLLEADELLAALRDDLLEVARNDGARWVPHAIEEQAESVDEGALEA